MTKFYENIISGLSERQALIKAQQYLRENGYADSKYWAPFILLDAADRLFLILRDLEPSFIISSSFHRRISVVHLFFFR